MFLETSYEETDPISKTTFIINKIVDSENSNIQFEVSDFKIKRCWNCGKLFYKINHDLPYGYNCISCGESLRNHSIYGEQN